MKAAELAALGNAAGVRKAESSATRDCDRHGGLAVQDSQPGGSGEDIRLPPRGEKPCAAGRDDVSERARKMGSLVEGTVEGDWERSSPFHHFAGVPHVHRGVRMEEAKDESRDPSFPCMVHGGCHGSQDGGRGEEVFRGRTKQDVDGKAGGANCLRDELGRRGQPANVKGSAKLDSSRIATLASAQDAAVWAQSSKLMLVTKSNPETRMSSR